MFAILGSLEVRGVPGTGVEAGARDRRLLLSMLLCEPCAPVRVDTLLDTLWGSDRRRPRNAAKALRAEVSDLRSLLSAAGGGDRIRFGGGGYRIDVSPSELDSLQFESLVSAGSDALAKGCPDEASSRLEQALDLWRGPMLDEFPDVPGVRSAVQRYSRMRLSVLEEWAEIELALGRPDRALKAVERFVLDYPGRERLRAAQILALRRLGREAEAHAVYDETRRVLADEFGLPPGQSLRRARLELEPELPADLTDFVGRQAETASAVAALTRSGRPRTVVLAGPVGVGKTALAVHVAHAVREHFADGVVLVDALAMRRSTAELLARLWPLARVPGAQPEDEDAAVALWQSHLAARRMLLILDGVPEDPGEAPMRLVPAGGHSAAMITTSSQRPSAIPGAVRISVPVRLSGLDEPSDSLRPRMRAVMLVAAILG